MKQNRLTYLFILISSLSFGLNITPSFATGPHDGSCQNGEVGGTGQLGSGAFIGFTFIRSYGTETNGTCTCERRHYGDLIDTASVAACGGCPGSCLVNGFEIQQQGPNCNGYDENAEFWTGCVDSGSGSSSSGSGSGGPSITGFNDPAPITLPTTTTTVSGRATGIGTCTMTLAGTTGPATPTISNPPLQCNPKTYNIANLTVAGSYTMTFRATDNNGSTDEVVNITVNAAAAPTGPNATANPTSSTIFVYDTASIRISGTKGTDGTDADLKEICRANDTASAVSVPAKGACSPVSGASGFVDFTFATNQPVGTHNLIFYVEDLATRSDSVLVTLTVNGAPNNTNPSVSVSGNQTITLPGATSASFTATASDVDTTDTIDSLNWSQTAGPMNPAIAISNGDATTDGNPKSNQLDITGITMPGVYTFRATATDILSTPRTGSATVTLTVQEAPTADGITGNIAMVPTATASVNAFAQFDDRDNNIVTIDWSGTNGATFTGASCPLCNASATDVRSDVTVNLPNPGDYTITAIATDATGLTRPQTFTIHKNVAPTIGVTWTAAAGWPAPANISVPSTLSTTFTATASSPGEVGETYTYSWSYLSGPPTPPTMGSTTGSTFTPTVNEWGLHNFRLTVTDVPNGGVSSVDFTLDAILICPSGTSKSGLTCSYNWAEHTCGTDGFFASKMFDGVNLGKTVVNRKLACCLNGGATVNPADNNCTPPIDTPSASCAKLDCIETPALVPGATAFDNLYNAAGGDPSLDANVSRPNRLFLVDGVGRPITGYYNEAGDRCLLTGETPTQQMNRYDTSIATTSPPAGMDRNCRFLVRAALEVRCPANTGVVNPTFRTAGIAGGPASPVIRCPAASEVIVHLDISDIASPAELALRKKIAFKRTNSLMGIKLVGDKSTGQRFNQADINMSEIITQKFAACPPGFVLDADGICSPP